MSIYNMIDFDRIAGFDWDAGNERKSADKHAVSQAETEQAFVNRPLLLMDDHSHSETEIRYHAYGRTNSGRLLQVSFTMRANKTPIRVISARPMSARERNRYAQET
jgi:uncharacterized DUF497 family protein